MMVRRATDSDGAQRANQSAVSRTLIEVPPQQLVVSYHRYKPSGHWSGSPRRLRYERCGLRDDNARIINIHLCYYASVEQTQYDDQYWLHPGQWRDSIDRNTATGFGS